MLAARIARVRAEVAALIALEPDVDGETGPSLHAELCTATDQLRGFAARILARVEADGRWSDGGSRTFPDWAARTRRASKGAVRREVALGRALDETLPHMAEAVAAGTVTLEHAQVLARAADSSPARRAALLSGAPGRDEEALVELATRTPVDVYRRALDRWGTSVDTTSAEREEDAACAREYLTVARRRDGVALQGFLALENAELVSSALRAVAGVPAKDDTRTREQRQAAALVDAAHLVLDRGLAGGGNQVRPHLLVHVPLETLERLEAVDAEGAEVDGASGDLTPERFDSTEPAQLSDGTPLTPTTLARLACDGELTRIVFGADGAVLDVGRAQRTYSGQQRLAVIARDASCRYPGCGAPPTLGEVHHVLSWADHGRTSVANGILLCWYHHRVVHQQRIRIRRVGGRWRFSRRDGTPITESGSPPTEPNPEGASGGRPDARVPGKRATDARASESSIPGTRADGTRADGTRADANRAAGTRAPDRSRTGGRSNDPAGPEPASWGGPSRTGRAPSRDRSATGQLALDLGQAGP
ncbi:DUF222 domain-containing protein [Isoptericola sp. b441]|uniref:DUF222 domain-containing protein n=1 Tax=Actinotalea lenta TaxID=3064654 RepID=A0ABT9D775_9CELL|nr:DUF222 domain-containing protein [Isoptericola sp. b441]MDO8106044.1 DUF222 domain-containing protein [Isoptericola sp. b441]